MPNITKFVSAGWDTFQWAYRAPAGWMAGAANLTASNTGVSSSMARHLGAVNAPFAIPEKERVNITGDDGTIAQFLFDAAELPSFAIEVSVFDAAFYQAVSTITGVTDGDVEQYGVPFNGATPASLMLMFSAQAKSQVSGQVGAKGYMHLLLLNCELSIPSASLQARTGTTFSYTVVCNESDVMPDGRTIASVFPTAPNGKLGALLLTSDYRYSYATLIGNNTLQKIVTTQRPISSAKAKATVETTGFAADTVASVVTSAPFGVNITATPANGKAAVAKYEFLNW